MSPASHRHILHLLCSATVTFSEKLLLLKFQHNRFYEYILDRFQRLNYTVSLDHHHRIFIHQYILCNSNKRRSLLLTRNFYLLTQINQQHGIAERLRAARVRCDSSERISSVEGNHGHSTGYKQRRHHTTPKQQGRRGGGCRGTGTRNASRA